VNTMNNTIPPVSLAAVMKALLRWLTASSHSGNAGTRVPATTLRSQLIQSTPNATPRPVQTRPLRVLQVMEVGQGGRSPGRLRISGRMADVCAELDRLAAHEALLG